MQLRIPIMLLAAVLAAGVPHSTLAQSGAVKSALSQTSPVHTHCRRAAEQYVVQTLRVAESVDLSGRRDRNIKGACLNSLITAGDKGRPLRIAGAIVVDSLIVDFSDVTIPVFLERTTFRKEVKFSNSRFRWDVVLDGSIFEGPVDLSGAAFDADLLFRDAVFRAGLNGYRARVGGDLEAMRTTFDEVDFRGLNVKGEAKFEGIIARRFDAERAMFEGDVVFTHSQFVGQDALLDLERATIKQSLFLNSLDAATPVVNLVYTEVGYSLGAHENVWGHSVNMRGMHTGKHLDLRHGIFNNEVILQAAQVGADLKLDSVIMIRGAIMDRAHVTGTLWLRGAEFGQILSLAEVDTRTLNITGLHKVPPPDSFSVDGLTFQHMENMVEGKSDFRGFIHFLNSAEFSPDAYGVLESFFARHGEKGFANKTLYERRARELPGLPFFSKAGSVLLSVTVRYGRRPGLAFFWWLTFVSIGWFVFRKAKMTLVDADKASARNFHPFWYSLDTFLPMVDLKYADDWKLTREDNGWRWTYLRGHTLAGWVLIPIALAAISGLMK